MALDRILVVDDQAVIRNSLVELLRARRITAVAAEDLASAEERLEHDTFDLVFLDMRLPDGDGTELLGKISQMGTAPPVVMITAHGTIQNAVECMKLGAFDFLQKPFSRDQITFILDKIESHNRLVSVNRYFQNEQTADSELIGNSEPIRQLKAMIRKVAATEATVLITGENGTGKEMVGREIYRLSPRRDQPYIRVNCAAISENLIESEFFGHEKGAFTGALQRREGRFELADKGTILLDEIGEIEPSAQVKLLRVLQEREFERVGGNKTIHVDTRVLATTNRDLRQAVRDGGFREDLYYRLNIFPLHMPPLRERGEDIILLAGYFLKRLCRKHGLVTPGFSARAIDALRAHPWPGNVRELQNIVERAVILTNPGERVNEEALGLIAPATPIEIATPKPAKQPPSEPAREPADTTIPEPAPAPAPPQTPQPSPHPATEQTSLADLERNAILDALARHGGNRKAVSEALDISPRTLRSKLQQYREEGYNIPEPGR